MSDRYRLDALPLIPIKKDKVPPRVFAMVAAFKQKDRSELTLTQRAWLAEFDEKHGDGTLKALLLEEVSKTTEITRRVIDVQLNPEVERERAEGLRADKALTLVVEGQRESSKAIARALESVEKRQLALDQQQARLIEDYRQLLQLAFTQNGALADNQISAMETLREGTKALAESEVAVKGAEIQIAASAQAAASAQQQQGGKLRNKVEDMLIGGIAAKLGLPLEFLMDEKKSVQTPTNGEDK